MLHNFIFPLNVAANVYKNKSNLILNDFQFFFASKWIFTDESFVPVYIRGNEMCI